MNSPPSRRKARRERRERLLELLCGIPDLVMFQRDRIKYFRSREEESEAPFFPVNLGVEALCTLDRGALALLFDATRTKKRFGFGAVWMVPALVGDLPPTMFTNGAQHEREKDLWLSFMAERHDALVPAMERVMERYLGRWRELGRFCWGPELEALLADFCFDWLLEVPGRAPPLRSWLDAIFSLRREGSAEREAEEAYYELRRYIEASPGFERFAERAERAGLGREWACKNLLFTLGFNAWAGLLGLCRSLIGELSLHPELAWGDRGAVGDLELLLETLRLRPPVDQLYVEAVDELSVEHPGGTQRIDPGTLLMTSAWVVHRDPSLFAEPERFRPGRFVDDPGLRRHLIWANGYDTSDPTAHDKMCAGRDQVLLAALTFLRLLVPGHRWELKDPPEWDPQESGEAGGPTSDLEVERFVHVATVDPEQAARTRDRAIQGP